VEISVKRLRSRFTFDAASEAYKTNAKTDET